MAVRQAFFEPLFAPKHVPSASPGWLCIPVSVTEVFYSQSSPRATGPAIPFFIVDCRPAVQYHAGHLSGALLVDPDWVRCRSGVASPARAPAHVPRQMLNDPAKFRAALARLKPGPGQHIACIGSGYEEEDQYMRMIVSHLLQHFYKHVSIVDGGYNGLRSWRADGALRTARRSG